MSIAAGSRTITAASEGPAVLTTEPWPPMSVASAGAMYMAVTPPASASLLRGRPGCPEPKVPNGVEAAEAPDLGLIFLGGVVLVRRVDADVGHRVDHTRHH